MGNTPIWKKITTEEGAVLYEGFTLYGKPYGAGTSYFPSGQIYQEGLFGVKGLLLGREYFPNGVLRFEGIYRLNCAYGPNFPRYGKCSDVEGEVYYEGEFRYHFGGVGYPSTEDPKAFGPVVQSEKPDVPVFMWDDERRRNGGKLEFE